MNSTSSENLSPKQSGPKRSRTGCLTCRARRRKCDEAKPKCQNCILKGFECRYAAAFQILGKNNYTPEVLNNVKYTNLKFVSNPGMKDEQETKGISPSTDMDLENLSTPIKPRGLQPILTSERDTAVTQNAKTSAERYESALHGLLALRNRNAGDLNQQLDLLNFPEIEETSIGEIWIPNQSHVGPPSALDIADHRRMQIGTSDNSGVSELSDEVVLELLKRYRYGIAPWLDIIDMKHFFGSEVLHLSTISAPIRYAVLALANQSLNGINLNLTIPAHHHRLDSIEEMAHNSLLDVLEMIKIAVGDLSTFWLQNGTTDRMQRVMDTLLQKVNNSSVTSSVFWLMTRLQLSVALMSPHTVKIPLPASLDPSLCCTISDSTDRVLRYAQEGVGLCVNATIFSRGDEDRWQQQRYGMNRVELWRKLASGFDEWYRHRPQEFHPVIELYPTDGRHSEDEFPTIVFSSGAATFANQLCHTGMLLLLQNKPRFITLPYSDSSTMSLLWQTHRVCGIAVNNDRWDCWDPVLVASLLAAAGMTTGGT